MKFTHKGHEVQIVLSLRKTKKEEIAQYWFLIDGRSITYTASEDKSAQLARNYIDVIDSEYYCESRQVWINQPSKV